MTLQEDPLSVQDVFGELKRFHIYDHDTQQWVMSGVRFGEKVVVKHRYGDDIERYRNLDILTDGKDELQLVWEDSPEEHEDPYLEDVPIDMDDAGALGELAQDAVAEALDEHPDDIMVATVEAPNVVTYRRTDEPIE